MPESINHEDPTLELHIADILDCYRQELREGEDPDPEACLDAHPELAADLADCLQGLAAMEELRTVLSTQPSPAFAPRSLGDFQLVREIGRGGMGVVYEANHTRLARRVALKMIRAGSLADGQDLELFREEALAVACLQHPNIVQLYEVGEHEGQPYLVLEYIDGGSLDAKLAGTPLEPYQAARLVETLARAMHCAHEHGVIHRDLKPANVLLASGGRKPPDASGDSTEASGGLRPPLADFAPKVTDFGLAKRLHADLGQTQSGTIKGTPSYMAPEQASGRTREVGPATDVYALGAILYETLTGRPPFRAATALETLLQVTSLEPVPPSRLQPGVPRDLETICLKCLQKEARKRYASAQDLADELGRFLRYEPIQARPVGVRGRVWRWCRRNPGVAWMAAVAGVLSIVVGLLAVLRLADAAASRAREASRRAELLGDNGYAAQGVANSILIHLRDLSSAVETTARKPNLRTLLEKEDGKGLQDFFEKVHIHYDNPKEGLVGAGGEPPFKSWYVLSAHGILLAVTPANPKVVGMDFQGRDYFQGALRRARQTGRAAIHISRVFRSRNDDRYKFGIATVVHGEQGKILGVVVATVTTNSTMGLLQLHDERQKA
ncbi:MAG TPA: serine/threonine protein kinase, partial [Gemmataceae bacterium]|nr:serine/threonine protein kinase [Gemmataceae bacterium]